MLKRQTKKLKQNFIKYPLNKDTFGGELEKFLTILPSELA